MSATDPTIMLLTELREQLKDGSPLAADVEETLAKFGDFEIEVDAVPEPPPTAGRMRILMNKNVTMSKGKYAAQAVHAALLLLGVHPGTPVVVLGGSPAELRDMTAPVHDAGLTELAPGTLTAAAGWDEGHRA